MHEMSIAQALLKTVLHEAANRQLGRITRIVVRIGPFSGIMTEALHFGFEAIRRDTPLAATTLAIEEAAAQARCQNCDHAFDLYEPVFSCPRCGSDRLTINGGDDLHIAYLEVENSHE